jgi:hypothetical protein
VDASAEPSSIQNLSENPWFQNNLGWLLLIDNLGSDENFLPICEHGSVILTVRTLTTRRIEFLFRCNKYVTLSPHTLGLDESEALQLLMTTAYPLDNTAFVENNVFVKTLLKVPHFLAALRVYDY